MKHSIIIPSHQGHCVTCIYSCLKFYYAMLRESSSIWAAQSPTSRGKNMILLAWINFGFNIWKLTRSYSLLRLSSWKKYRSIYYLHVITSVFHWQFRITFLFSVSLKFGACYIFSSMWVFFYEDSRFIGQQVKGESCLFNPSLLILPVSVTLRH